MSKPNPTTAAINFARFTTFWFLSLAVALGINAQILWFLSSSLLFLKLVSA